MNNEYNSFGSKIRYVEKPWNENQALQHSNINMLQENTNIPDQYPECIVQILTGIHSIFWMIGFTNNASSDAIIFNIVASFLPKI